jgi:hypothetical protein
MPQASDKASDNEAHEFDASDHSTCSDPHRSPILVGLRFPTTSMTVWSHVLTAPATGLSSEAHIEPLNDTNWETCSFLMGQYLTVNYLWDIVAGAETASESHLASLTQHTPPPTPRTSLTTPFALCLSQAMNRGTLAGTVSTPPTISHKSLTVRCYETLCFPIRVVQRFNVRPRGEISGFWHRAVRCSR